MEKYSLEERDLFLSQEVINPGQIIDYLQELGSRIHVVTVAEMMRSGGQGKIYPKNKAISHIWQEGLVLIRQMWRRDVVFFKERVQEIKPSSPGFLREFGQEIHRVGYLLLSHLAKLQEKVSLAWYPSPEDKNILSALEIFFRHGELLRFQNILGSLQKEILSAYQTRIYECIEQTTQQDQGQLDLEQAIQRLREVADFIISFYDQKWSLLLGQTSPLSSS